MNTTLPDPNLHPHSHPGSKERILTRIREALRAEAHGHGGDEPLPSADERTRVMPPVPDAPEERVALFAKHCEDLRTEFFDCGNLEAARERLLAISREAEWKNIATHRAPLLDTLFEPIQADLPEALIVESGYDRMALEACDAAVTGCECLVAQTGSIMVTARSSGGRVLSVLPPHHVVVATRDQIVRDLAAAYAHVRKTHGGEPPAWMSFITGPSRTGDIERIMVLGAHGPKRLTVLLLDP